jgi:hypothetical protein
MKADRSRRMDVKNHSNSWREAEVQTKVKKASDYHMWVLDSCPCVVYHRSKLRRGYSKAVRTRRI